MEKQFTVNDKTISVYPSISTNRPVVYLNTFAGEGSSVYKALQGEACSDFTFVTISGLDWNNDMAPWDIPPISKNDTPCTGGADEYLRLLTDEIIPKAEKEIEGTALWRGIAGYSLAGLFAVYSLYRREVFSRAASMSGSLWFPKFKEYVFTNKMKSKPEYIYFSLGDKECKTRNPYLKVVQDNTEKIEAFYQSKGIDTVFRLNQGNHYKDAAQRTAAGIKWILDK